MPVAPVPITRRALLGGAAGAMAAATAARAAPARAAIIDWAVLETALALGIAPIAATELIQYRKVVVEPEVPANVADIGLRGVPNYELLRILDPDLILISNFYEEKRRQLEHIAPVRSLLVYVPGQAAYPLAVEIAVTLGDIFGRRDAADRYLAETEQELERARTALASGPVPSAYVVKMGDMTHLQAFGPDSIFGDVMSRLGIANAWTHGTRYSAAAPVGLEALAAAPDAAVVVLAPLPPEFERTQSSNALWQALPAVRRGNVAFIPSVNDFGGLPSARRFARLLVAAMRDLDRVRRG